MVKGTPLDDPYASPHWDEPLVTKAQRSPAKAQQVIVLMASSPRKRYFVGDAIPVQLEVRNHTIKNILSMSMSLVLVTYGVVMARGRDQVPHVPFLASFAPPSIGVVFVVLTRLAGSGRRRRRSRGTRRRPSA